MLGILRKNCEDYLLTICYALNKENPLFDTDTYKCFKMKHKVEKWVENLQGS